MSDLIEREAALKAINPVEASCELEAKRKIYAAIEKIPAAYPKKGKLIISYQCSVCGTGLDTASNYCPYCGAEMEEEE